MQGDALPARKMHDDQGAKPAWYNAPIWSQVPKLSPSKPAMGTPMGRMQAQQLVPHAFWPPKYTPLADRLVLPVVLGQLTE